MESSLTSERDFAAKGEEWFAVNERKDGPVRIREVTEDEDVWGKKVTSRKQVVNGDCTKGSRCYLGKESLETQGTYLDRENLCTTVEPRCGGCKCGKCPIPGSRFSHREEGELRKIRDNLVHNGRCWQTSYPFLYPRELLRATYKSGLRVLHSTERSLKKNGWGERYNACIEEMLQ